jgi:hypothetical protein
MTTTPPRLRCTDCGGTVFDIGDPHCTDCAGPGSTPAPRITVRSCQRCGQDHEVAFRPLTNPADIHTHWGVCPNVGQPITLSISFQPSTRREPHSRTLERDRWLASLPPMDGRADYGRQGEGASFSVNPLAA